MRGLDVKCLLWGFGLFISILVLAGGPAEAQEMDLSARKAGRALPPSFYQRIAEQPDFFQLKAGWRNRTAQAVSNQTALTGTLPMAIILGLFSDSPDPHISHQEVQAANFEGPNPFGTVSEAYAEMSGGRFAVSGQAFPWVRTSLTMSEVVGTGYGLGDDSRAGEYFFEAVAAADATLDFGLFDNDGPDNVPNSGDDDGQVDAVAFQFLEIAASCGGPSIWPHRSRLSGWSDSGPYVTDDLQPNGDPITVNDYMTQGATDCGGIEAQKATTISHELGHVLGLPDLYDRSQGLLPQERRWVVGCWSLMAAGAWGCGWDTRTEWVTPTHMGPYEKNILGWLGNYQYVGSVLDQEFILDPVQTGEQVLKVPLTEGSQGDNSPYLLIEYRTQEGFDLNIPASGVLVYHVDPTIGGNRPCDTCPQVYRVALLEADGNNTLRLTYDQGGNRGEAGDAWGVTGPGTLTNNTYPSTRLNSGQSSAVSIYEISIQNGQAHVTLSSRRIPVASLTQPLMETFAPHLTAEEEAYLDRYGNGNGQYDVGDMRAYLRR